MKNYLQMAKNYLTKGKFAQDLSLEIDFIGGRKEDAAEYFRDALENFGNNISIGNILGIKINYLNQTTPPEDYYKISFNTGLSQQLSNAFYDQVMKGHNIQLGGYFGGFNRWCNKVRSELKSRVVKNQADAKKGA